jgi:small nuclear ribonucleoprotein D3
MSLRGNHGVGIPSVLFREGEGLVLTVETKSGHVFRGTVVSTEDSMNVSMKDVMCTDPEGTRSHADRLYLRGNTIVYAIFPDILHNAPFFERVAKAARGITVAGGLGRGRQQAITAKGKL